MKNKKNLLKDIFEDKQFVITILLILFISVFLFFYFNDTSFSSNSDSNSYSVKIIEISANCEDCFDVNTLTNSLIDKGDLNIKSNKVLVYNSTEGKKVIEKYNINTVPALIIISKDIKKIGIDDELFRIEDKFAIFDKSVPYFDLEDYKIKGMIQLKEIEAENCLSCSGVSQLGNQITELGVKISDYEKIPSYSEKGKELIKNNNLEFVPALLISKNIEKYWWIFPQLQSYMIEKQDGYLFNSIPPYLDLKEKKIKGMVDITFIENKSCEDCFNVTLLGNSFLQFGIYFENKNTVDVETSEGKSLLKKYNITAIPTVILSSGILDYEYLNLTLKEGGTFEKDGKFVFRNLDLLNVEYQKLK